MREAENIPDHQRKGKELDAKGKVIKTEYEKLIGKANALRNRVIERLTIDKQRKTIHEIGDLLDRNKHEVEFQHLKALITPHKIDVAKTADEFENLETEVGKMLDSHPKKGETFNKDALILITKVLKFL